MRASRPAEKLREEALARLRAGQPAACATVVRVEGSSYRREGASMLIRSRYDAVGTISGGCLETDVLAKALDVLETGAASLLQYDMRTDNDAWWGIGSGCNGMVDVLLHRPDPSILETLTAELEAQRSVYCVTVVGGESPGVALGAQALRREDGGVQGQAELSRAVSGLSPDTWTRGGCFTVEAPGSPRAGEPMSNRPALSLFVERLEPSVTVLIVGVGQDAEPMARMASDMGARVVVADHRSQRLTREVFPVADRFVHATPENAPEDLFGERTYAVLMTHNFEWDARWLCRLLPSSVPYIGLLGPRARGERLLAGLRHFGLDWTRVDSDWRERVHNPLGLSLGGEGAGPIAVAAAAEILAKASGRDRSKLGARTPWNEDTTSFFG